jgi:hypothetical protein
LPAQQNVRNGGKPSQGGYAVEQKGEAMSAVVSGLIGAVVAFALVSLAERTQRSATAGLEGWKALRAGWLLNGTLIGAAALAALTGFFLLSGGSSRPDAATQNGFAALLFAAFTAGALYLAWTTWGRTIMWKDDELRVRSLWGGESLKRISDASKAERSELRGEYRITFRDGSRLRFSAHMHGADDLVAQLPRRALRD